MVRDLGVVIGALILSVATIFVTRALAVRRRWFDQPNARSAHVQPTARIGGVGIVISFVAASTGFLYFRDGLDQTSTIAFAGILAIATLGFVDDLLRISALVKLLVQLVIATMTVVSLKHSGKAPLLDHGGLMGWFVTSAVVGWIVWLTNLYNFMDGIDGLAGGQAMFASLAVAIAAHLSGNPIVAGVMAVLAGSSLGFLLFNFPPASIFMGDVGSTAIGFTFGVLPLLPMSLGVPLIVWPLAVSLFILDASVTLLRRLARRENVLRAHRSHVYQRPLSFGVPHRTITLVAYGGMLLVGASAAVVPILTPSERIGAAAIPLITFVSFMFWVSRIERTISAPKT